MRSVGIALLCSALCAGGVEAQQVTIDGGLTWLGGYAIGVSDAELRTNAPGATPPPFTLFSADSRLGATVGGEVRGGVDFGGWSVEGSAAYARRRLAFSISGDSEAAAASFDGESVQRYEFGAGVTWRLPWLHADRVRTFAAGGATYLRELHQDRTLVETGSVIYAGAGARYWLWGRPDGRRSIGLRGDVRINVRRNAIDFEDNVRTYPSLSLLLFLAL